MSATKKAQKCTEIIAKFQDKIQTQQIPSHKYERCKIEKKSIFLSSYWKVSNGMIKIMSL